MIQCGMSEIIITPPLGSSIPGQFYDRKAQGIKDELYTKIIILDNGKVKLCLIAIDSIGLIRQDVERIRKLVFKITGISPGHTMVSATHTHTGGAVCSLYQSSRDEAYVYDLMNKIEIAITNAWKQMQPALLGFGLGKADNISFCRRFFMKDGGFATNPGIGSRDIEKPAGVIDPDVSVMRIDDLKGNPIGVITNFACHPDTVCGIDGENEFCADYPGEMSNVIKGELGQNVVSIFLNGACGNINHIDVSGNMAVKPGHYKKMGRILAHEVLKTREKIKLCDQAVLNAAGEKLELPVRIPSDQDIQWANQILGSEKPIHMDFIKAKEYLKLQKQDLPFKTAEIQAIRIGDLFIGAFPGELFVELGNYIKMRTVFKYTMINTLSNGMEGYLPTREAFQQGGYETGLTAYTNLAAGAGERMTESMLNLMEKIK